MKKEDILVRLDIMLGDLVEDLNSNKRSLLDPNNRNCEYLNGYHKGRMKQADSAINRIEELYLKISESK